MCALQLQLLSFARAMAAVDPAAGGGASAAPEPAAFKALYPEQYLERFLEAGVRADERPLGRARAATCVPPRAARAATRMP